MQPLQRKSLPVMTATVFAHALKLPVATILPMGFGVPKALGLTIIFDAIVLSMDSREGILWKH